MQDSPFVLGFTAGELSPWLATRFDLQAYQRGAAKISNFMVQPYGGVRRRCGSEYVGAAAVQGSDSVRLVPFCFSESDSLMLEFYPGGMRVYQNGVLLKGADGATYVMSTPWTTAAEISSLHVTQVNDMMYVTCPYREPYVISRFGDTDWLCELFEAEPFPRETYMAQRQGIRVQIASNGYSATLSLDSGRRAFTEKMLDKEMLMIDAEIPPETLFLNQAFTFSTKTMPDLSTATVVGGTVYTEYDAASKMYNFYSVKKPYLPRYYNGSLSAADYPDCFLQGVMRLNSQGNPYEVCGDWELHTHGEWNAVWELWRSYDSYSDSLDINKWHWTRIRTVSQNAYSERKNYAISGTEERPCRMVLVCRSADGANLSGHIYFNILGGSREYRFILTSFTSAQSAGARMVSDYMDGPTSFYSRNWSFGAFGPRNGYPSFSGLHQGRLWLGGMAGLPTTLLASSVDDYGNFDVSSADDGALHLTISVANQSRINWICPARSLLVGTTEGEWTLSSPDGSALSGTNASFTRQSSVGSDGCGADGVENTVFYVQRGGKRLREISYKLAADGFTSTDTSLLAEHLFSAGVREWCVQRGSSAGLWVLMNDFSVAVLTMNAEQQVTAWQRMEMPGRDVLHLAALPRRGNNEDELWMVVRNKETGFISIERIVSEGVFTDGTVLLRDAVGEDGSFRAGVHLAGLSGYVWPLGSPEQAMALEFDAEGICVVPEYRSGISYCAGAGYLSELHTLPMENSHTYNTVRQEGRVRLRLLESNPSFHYKATHVENWELYDPARDCRSFPYSGEIRVSQFPEPGVGQGFALCADGTLDFRLVSMTVEFDFHGR